LGLDGVLGSYSPIFLPMSRRQVVRIVLCIGAFGVPKVVYVFFLINCLSFEAYVCLQFELLQFILHCKRIGVWVDVIVGIFLYYCI
jgi:hypothetical protein